MVCAYCWLLNGTPPDVHSHLTRFNMSAIRYTARFLFANRWQYEISNIQTALDFILSNVSIIISRLYIHIQQNNYSISRYYRNCINFINLCVSLNWCCMYFVCGGIKICYINEPIDLKSFSEKKMFSDIILRLWKKVVQNNIKKGKRQQMLLKRRI